MKMFPKFQLRSPYQVLDEIGQMIEIYSVREIADDTGTLPVGNWLETFCKGMINRGYNKKILISGSMRFDQLQDLDVLKLMKKAGFRKLKCGLESANQKTLDRIGKGINVEQIINGCRNAALAGLKVHLTIMVGYPWENRIDVKRTFMLVKHLMRSGYIEMLQSTVLVPYPGTQIHEEALTNGWFRIDPKEYSRYDMREPILISGDMSAMEIMSWNRKIYSLHFDLLFILHRIIKIRSLEDICYLLRGVPAILSHVLDFISRKRFFIF